MRLRSLDVLRAVAILLVIGRHGPRTSDSSPQFVKEALDIWHRVGWTGVDLFFVLSGFLISGLLFAEHRQHGDVRLRRFFVRRGLKIYPPFYALLIVSVGVVLTTGSSIGWSRVTTELLYLQDYFPGLYPHTWSLAVEEQFYLLIGIMVYWSSRSSRFTGKRMRFESIPLLFPIIALGCLVCRIWTSSTLPFALLSHHYPLHLRLDALFFGVLLGWMFHFRAEQFAAIVERYGIPIAWISFVLVTPALAFDLESSAFMRTVGLTLLYLGFGGMVAVAASIPSRGPSALDPLLNALAWLGVISYSVYLWHIPTALVLSAADISYGLQWLTYISGSVLLGWLATRLVETPILKMRDRMFPSRSAIIHRAS